MTPTPYKLHRLASDHHQDRLAMAERVRTARLARDLDGMTDEGMRTAVPLAGLRSRFADALVGLAARLSPTHRDVLCELRPSACAPARA